ncbi:MAG: putative signaling protein [Chloroflexi bacterium OLB14]|nr:MAG: putative signaling protein [Chloroflexi bacterium OLB14]
MTEHNSSDNMQNRINNIFTGSDVPSPASLKEMESLRNRVRELEEQIKLQETETAKIKEEALQSSGSFGLYPSSDSLHRTATSKVNTQAVQKSWLPSFFTAPVFADDLEKTQSAKLLYQIITVVWAIPVILFLIWLFGNRPEAIGPAIIIAMGLLALMWLARSGWVNLANGFMAMMIVLVFGYADYINAGNPQPSTLMIAVTIIMSGLLLGRRAPVITAVLVVLTHIVIVYLQMQGVIKLNSEPAVGFENMVITGGMTLVIGFLFQFVITRLQVSLERTRHNERELQVSNRELRELGVSLEKRVQDRTRDLELASEVGRTVTAKVNDLNQLLSDAVEQIRSRFNLYYTQVYLTDRAGRMITLRAGTGAVGKQLLQRGHQLLISSDSLNGRAALDKRAVIVLDTSKHPAFLPNPLLPKTRSEMTVPLIVGDQVLGVLDMQSDVPNSLNENNLPAFESLAGQLAVAIQNASLFEQANQARAEVIEQAKRLSLDNWDNFLNAVERSEKIGYVFNQNEILPYLNQPNVAEANTLDTPILVAGAEIGKIQIVDDADRQWTVDESNLIQNTAMQLANHIENLRLLAQSEKYRTEAEQVTKRLTREGWREYFATQKDQVNGFAYDQYQVLPLSENGHYAESLQTHPIYVRDEQVGELAIVQNESLNEETNEIINAVTQQLSTHIENLRLLEQTEQKRIEAEALLRELDSQKFALDQHSIVAITDQTGEILYANDKFVEISKYSREELLGQDHRILNSGYHSKEFMRNLWVTIANGKV